MTRPGLAISPPDPDDARGLWTRFEALTVAGLSAATWHIAGGLVCALWAALTALLLVGGV